MKAEMKQRIYNGLKREFTASVSRGKGYPPIADGFWLKIADAISDIAMDIVNDIHNDAIVVPGQAVATVTAPCIPGVSVPTTGTTVAPGKID